MLFIRPSGSAVLQIPDFQADASSQKASRRFLHLRTLAYIDGAENLARNLNPEQNPKPEPMFLLSRIGSPKQIAETLGHSQALRTTPRSEPGWSLEVKGVPFCYSAVVMALMGLIRLYSRSAVVLVLIGIFFCNGCYTFCRLRFCLAKLWSFGVSRAAFSVAGFDRLEPEKFQD